MAVKTVTWKKENNLNAEYMVEDLPWVFSNILSPYFKHSHNHIAAPNPPLPFTALFICEHPNQMYSQRFCIDPISTEYDLDNFYFYDKLTQFYFDSISPNTMIMYGEQEIGILTPNQVLYATDWTHSHYSRDVILHIINYLVEAGLLKEVGSFEEKEKEPILEEEYVITIGCDPEFELVSEEKIHHASGFLGDDFNKDTFPYGNIGLDGSSEVVELRPSPGTPEQVVENIRGLLQKYNDEEETQDSILASSSDKYPCGGHIHIGVSPKPVSNDFISGIVTVLNDFIGYPTKNLNGPARSNSSYGRIGDWREQEHGIEYRTPPSAVFHTPEFTNVTLQLAYNLSYMLANDKKLQYNTPVTKEDLVLIGGLTYQEAEFYIRECNKDIPSSGESMMAAWNIKMKPPRIKIEFSEEWEPEVKEFVLTLVDKIKPHKSAAITLFGLKQERGDVYTFYTENHGMFQNSSHNDFGFSRKFRMGGESKGEMFEILKSLFSTIGFSLEKENNFDFSIPIIQKWEFPQEKDKEISAITYYPKGHIVGPGEQFPVGTVFQGVDWRDNQLITLHLTEVNNRYKLWVPEWDRYYGPNDSSSRPVPSDFLGSFRVEVVKIK